MPFPMTLVTSEKQTVLTSAANPISSDNKRNAMYTLLSTP